MIASMIFFPEKTLYEQPVDYGLAFEDVFLETPDRVRLHGWFLPALREEKGVILFFHGNAGNISHRLYKVKRWVELGFSVFLLDYRGYGQSGGSISNENDVLTDARTAFEWLAGEKKKQLVKTILYGESLGTHPVLRLAAEHRVAAVILEAPFTSFLDLARRHYPLVPALLLKNFEFSNTEVISKVKSPVFIMHGTDDEICPYAMGGELFEQTPNPKEFFTIAGGRHNDLPVHGGDDFWDKPFQFLSKYL